MATHDYVISNASGASVRADLNNALAAIVSNNSNATSPATTYAFQFWADTTTGQLKIRNAANSAWITLMELDGTMLMEDGTVSAPGLAFASDTNTGFFRSAADKINFATGGAERLEIGSSEVVFNDPSNDVDFRVESNGNANMLFVDGGNDRVGIGFTAEQAPLEVQGENEFASSASTLATAATKAAFRVKGSTNSSDSLWIGVETSAAHPYIQGANGIGSASKNLLLNPFGGNVGIGTTSPQRALVVSDAGDEGFEFFPGSSDTGNTLNHFDRGSSAFIDITTNADQHIFGRADGEKMRIDGSGRLLIATSSSTANSNADDLQIGARTDSGERGITVASSAAGSIRFADDGNDTAGYIFYSHSDNSLRLGTDGSERARLDSSGRLLVGTSTGQSVSGHTPSLQVSGTDFSTATLSITNNANSSNGSYLFFCKQRSGSPGGSTVLQNGDLIGQLRWVGGDGTDMNTLAAIIQVKVDGTPGADDMPGRLEFYTTADGSNNPTERMRINRKGYMYLSTRNAIVDSNEHIIDQNQAAYNVLQLTANSNSYSASGGGAFAIGVGRTANSAYTIAGWYSGNGSTSSFNDREFRFRGDGNAYADGSFSGGGADYAEYFEWSDGNSSEEDRRGISVVLDGDKIREAVDGEEPIGVISANPSVVGDADDERWKNKYLRNDYGSYDLDENGDRQLNPAYDPDLEYISRENRPEWDTVGLMGKLRIRKGQVTGARWIKMRDVSDTVEEWLVR